jgi:hypothetical protein
MRRHLTHNASRGDEREAAIPVSMALGRRQTTGDIGAKAERELGTETHKRRPCGHCWPSDRAIHL